MSTPGERPKPWWSAVIMSAAAFVIVSFAYLAAGFGQPESPVNQFLNRNGATMIALLAGLTIGSGLLAMYLDQRHQQPRDPHPPSDLDGAGDLP